MLVLTSYCPRCESLRVNSEIKVALRWLSLLIVCSLLLAGCETAPRNEKIEGGLYKLYESTVAAYRENGPSDYHKRKTFYIETYNTLDVLDLRADIDNSFARSDVSVKDGLVALRAHYRGLEELDRRGELTDKRNLSSMLENIRTTTRQLIRRETIATD